MHRCIYPSTSIDGKACHSSMATHRHLHHPSTALQPVVTPHLGNRLRKPPTLRGLHTTCAHQGYRAQFLQSLEGKRQSIKVGVQIRPAETRNSTRLEHKALGRASWRSDTASQRIGKLLALSSHQAITFASAGTAFNKANYF
jgi:hypothetical protein